MCVSFDWFKLLNLLKLKKKTVCKIFNKNIFKNCMYTYMDTEYSKYMHRQKNEGKQSC